MFYCVRCGDKIDPGEMVCDKCGLRFRVTNNNGATVYINATSNPNAAKGKGKKKKKGLAGWLIALISVFAVGVAGICFFTILSVGLLLGIILFSDDSSTNEVVVETNPVNVASDESTSTYSNPIAYTNTGHMGGGENPQPVQDISVALRDQFVTLKGDGTDTVTVMVYMNGSDLESKSGMATQDLSEMLNATLSDNVNVVIQTGGTKKWKTEGISSKKSQRFIIKDGKLVLVDDTLPQLDITKEETLRDFINYCSANYPADRNILILWDHGGGVVYGYGVDENLTSAYEALTLDEIQRAVSASGVKFEMIGFDACLMGAIETACVLSDYADYLVASEDFESGSGWEYQNWLSLLGYNSSTPMTDVGKVIVDDFIKESIADDTEGVLALVDLRYARLLYSSWTNFAYANKDELLTYDYTMSMQRTARAPEYIFETKSGLWDWVSNYGYDSMEEYCYAVDILALAKTMNTDESNALSATIESCILYCSTTSGDSRMTGLSVTLPYGDPDFYDELKTVFNACGFDNTYISYLEEFSLTDSYSSYDWNSSSFNGWDSYYSDDYYDYYDWNDYDWDSYSSSDYDWDCYDYGDSSDWIFDYLNDYYYDDYYDPYYDDYYYDDYYYDDDYYYEDY